jgi:hypothetical protein
MAQGTTAWLCNARVSQAIAGSSRLSRCPSLPKYNRLVLSRIWWREQIGLICRLNFSCWDAGEGGARRENTNDRHRGAHGASGKSSRTKAQGSLCTLRRERRHRQTCANSFSDPSHRRSHRRRDDTKTRPRRGSSLSHLCGRVDAMPASLGWKASFPRKVPVLPVCSPAALQALWRPGPRTLAAVNLAPAVRHGCCSAGLAGPLGPRT